MLSQSQIDASAAVNPDLRCKLPKLMGKLKLDKMVSFLNEESFRRNYTYSGRFKIGQRILAKAPLPPGFGSASNRRSGVFNASEA
jgi:hypothetical protein